MKNLKYLIIIFITLSYFDTFGQINESLLTKSDNGEINLLSVYLDSTKFADNPPPETTIFNDSIYEVLNELKNKVNIQNEKIDQLTRTINEPKIDIFTRFIYPIFLSIIAAIIFWLTFSFFPEKRRKNKIRAKIDFEIYQVYTNVFALLDTIMRSKYPAPSNFQQKIRGNKLSSRDIELGLQNKCMNEHYFYDPVVKNNLLPIGQTLWHYAKKTDQIIDHIFSFSTYLESDEILMLENIRKKFFTYDLENFNREAVSIIGKLKLYPVNPSISYMKTNFTELYELFKEIQDLVFKNKLENRDIFLNKVQHYYYNEEYNKSLFNIKIASKKYPKDKEFLDFYYFLCKYKLNHKNEAFEKLEDIFKSKPNLVSKRDFIKEIISDKKVEELLHKYFSNTEINEMNGIMNKEKLYQDSFITEAKELEKYYKRKSEETKEKINKAHNNS